MDPNLEEYDGEDKGTQVEKEGAQHHIEDESSCQITLYEKAPESLSENKTKVDNSERIDKQIGWGHEHTCHIFK